MKKNNLKVVFLSPDDIVPNPNNAKIHTGEQIEQIKESIKDFGFNDPVAIDENNMIIEGHGRYMASKELSLEVIPVIILSGLSEEEKVAYSLIHNQLTMNTGFEYDLLKGEIESINSFDMTKYSFDILSESYFDETVQTNKNEKIIVSIYNDEQKNKLLDFLDKKGYSYKEK